MHSDHSRHKPPAPGFESIERKEGELWRTALLFLALLAFALLAASWDTFRLLTWRLEALPIGIVVLVVLFAAYNWIKRREISDLRRFLRALEQKDAAPPSEKQFEQLLRMVADSQQGYRDLIDSFDQIIFTLSLDGEIRAANRSFAAQLGESFKQLIGRRLDEFLVEPTRVAALRALPRFLDRRQWAGVVRVRLHGSPSVRYFDCLMHAVVKDAQVIGISVLGRDITSQRENEARFSELFATLQEGVYFTTPDGRFLDANPALVHMLGYDSKDELLELSVNDLYFEPGRRPALLRDLEAQGAIREEEITLRRKDGSPITCLDSATVIRDSEGRVQRYQGTLVDITQRRAMENRLHQEQEFARRLVECFPDLIVVLDTQARYTYVSPRVTELLGYTPEELLGQPMGERSSPEDRPAMLQLFQELVSGKRDYGAMDYTTLHRDGTWRVFRASVSPLYDTEGQIKGVVASARDISEMRRLQQQVIQSEKLAAMGQMIAGVAHELNNPLTAVLGVSDLLRESASDPTTRRQLDLVHQQARRAGEIVQNLLAYARPQAPRKVRLSLNDVVRRTLELHQFSLRANNIAVDFDPAPALPECVGDHNQLLQVFLNLIINAEQAIREVRDRGRIRFRLGSQGNMVRVTVEDDGPGIPQQVLPKIFDPFFTTKRPGGGTGLGLSICLAIVKEHGGEIEASPPIRGGAIFTVSLPVAPAIVATPAEPVAKHNGVSLRGVSVLAIDDEAGVRALISDGLSARGMNVRCSAGGPEALELMDKAIAAGQPYDLILCDLRTQGLSGRAFYESVRERINGGKLRLLFMSGAVEDGESTEYLREHEIRIVQKPFRISELVEVLAEVLTKAPAK